MGTDQPIMKNELKDPGSSDCPPPKRMREMDTQPPMMSFKAFLLSQDDNISDEEASAKYTEYKFEFRRQRLKEFFTAHKDDDWFKVKYHPSESVKRKEELKFALHKRASVFMELLNSGCLEGLSLESENADTVEKLLDVFVVRLEGSMTNDRHKEREDTSENSKEKESALQEDRKGECTDNGVKRDFKWIIIDDDGGDDEDDNTKLEKVNDALQFSDDINSKEVSSMTRSKDGSVLNRKEQSQDLLSPSNPRLNSLQVDPLEKCKEESKSFNCQPHKPRSIFLRNISSKISKREIEEVCEQHPGYLRVWLSDAQPDQNWCRRGFVTFRRDVNIKQICWNLNSVKIKGFEWQAVVNHDLVKRIRTANILANHKQAVMADMKLVTKIIQELDLKAGFWNQNKKDKKKEEFTLETGNPLFSGIMDHLVEEAPAEAEELLGQLAVQDEYNAQISDKLKILDKLLLYLRMVHSVDYYNGSQYIHEDEMPNRCGIIHLRSALSPTEATRQEVDEYIESHTEKLRPLFSPSPPLSQAALLSLGYKDKDTEIEKFIQTNTQELAPDKFLCPLSGKKFKAPEFVRKHIVNKFSHELELISLEAEYFNNYLMDVKRPELPDHPTILMKREFEQPHYFHYGGYRRGFPFGHFGGPGFFMRGRGLPGRGRGDYRPIVTYRDLDSPAEPDELV